MNIALTMLSLKLSGLKSYEKHILTTLCIRADEKTFECWPSIKCLVVDTGLDKKTIQMALVSLHEKKLIIKTGEMKGRTKSVPVYKLNISIPVNGIALKTSDPVYPKSDPANGSAKRSRKRVMEGKDLKDIKKDVSAHATSTSKTLTPLQEADLIHCKKWGIPIPEEIQKILELI